MEQRVAPGETENKIESIYGGMPGWLQSLAYHTPVFYAGFAKLANGALKDGALPRAIKELMLACVYSFQGFADGTAVHLKNAIDLGVTDAEIGEMLAAVVLSRGPRAYVEGYKAWQSLRPSVPGGARSSSKEDTASSEDILKYFNDYYGASLPHIRVLANHQQLDVLAGYYEMRTFSLSDVTLPRKLKEYIFIAINAADMRPEATAIHVKGAYSCGGTKEEVLEAMLIGLMAGGVASWLYAARVFEETLPDAGETA